MHGNRPMMTKLDLTDAELALQLEQADWWQTHQQCQGLPANPASECIDWLESRVDFLEELLEAPAHLRLRGGGEQSAEIEGKAGQGQ